MLLLDFFLDQLAAPGLLQFCGLKYIEVGINTRPRSSAGCRRVLPSYDFHRLKLTFDRPFHSENTMGISKLALRGLDVNGNLYLLFLATHTN